MAVSAAQAAGVGCRGMFCEGRLAGSSLLPLAVSAVLLGLLCAGLYGGVPGVPTLGKAFPQLDAYCRAHHVPLASIFVPELGAALGSRP